MHRHLFTYSLILLHISLKPLRRRALDSSKFHSWGLPLDAINCSIIDKTGNIWLVPRAGVTRYDGKKFTTYTNLQGCTQQHYFCITEDKYGNIWFGSFGGG